MKFELNDQKAKLAHFNARSELEGEDRRPAADIKLECALTVECLAMFGPQLRASWYESGEAPALRNPRLTAPFAWEDEIVGATLTIRHGISAKSDLVITGCMVNNFRLHPMEGGSVIVGFRVQCHPDEKCAGRLYAMVQTEIECCIEPAQSELDV